MTRHRTFGLLSSYGLLALVVVLFGIFALAEPSTFPTSFNIRSIVADQSVVAIIALGVMVPLAAGQYDLSCGYAVGLYNILIIGMQVNHGWSWWQAIAAVIAAGAVVGLVVGLLVTRFEINSFIATLGVGTILFGFANWYTNGTEIVLQTPGSAFNAIDNGSALIPAPAWYVVVIAVVLFVALEHLPIGRQTYVVGANPRAAELVGIRSQRLVVLSFVVAGLLYGVAAAVLASKLAVGQATEGPEFLLPAFAAALLGSTSIRPGRVNVVGTIVAVALLAITVSGLEHLGAAFWVEDLFNGTILLIAVGVAVYAGRKQAQVKARAAGRQADVASQDNGRFPGGPSSRRSEAVPEGQPTGE